MTPNGPAEHGGRSREASARFAICCWTSRSTAETSLLGSAKAEEEALRWLQTNLGETIDRGSDASFIDGASAVSTGASGVAEAMQSFFNAFSGLAADPTSSAERQSVFQQAGILVDRSESAASRLDDLQVNLDASISAETEIGQRHPRNHPVAQRADIPARDQPSGLGP